MTSFETLLQQVRACSLCREHLPFAPKPVIQIHPHAKILIAGQAPGRKVQETGLPFNDPSGNRLRDWLGMSREEFYDEQNVALVPMGFCYPGTGKSGDFPPRPECAPAWRHQLLAHLPDLEITLVLGVYAQAYHLKERKTSLTELVRSWQNYWPKVVPLPHPSPRNNIWLRNNPWFELEVIPVLKQRIAEILGRPPVTELNSAPQP